MQDKIRFKYRKAPGYTTQYIGGAWGGITPTGDVWVDFFHEHSDQPESIEFSLSGQRLTEISREGGKDYVRELLFGGIVRKDIAFSIGRWFLDKAYDASYSVDSEDIEWMEKRLTEFRQRVDSSD